MFSVIFEQCQSRDVTSRSKMASGEGLAQPKMASRESVKTYINMLLRKQTVVAEVCGEIHSKNDKKTEYWKNDPICKK